MYKVGVFDSGVGGLSVLSSMVEERVASEFYYFGDTARVPYGSKSRESIVKYSLEALDHFESIGIDVLVVACNSVSACAIKELKEQATFPVIGVVEAGVESVVRVASTFEDNILVIGTKATVNSGAYSEKLSGLGFENIQSLATPLLVNLVEEDVVDQDVVHSVLEYYFKGVKVPDIIVLGCTHFPMLKSQIQSFFPSSNIVHCGYAIVSWLYEHDLASPKEIEKISIKIDASDNPARVTEYVNKWVLSDNSEDIDLS